MLNCLFSGSMLVAELVLVLACSSAALAKKCADNKPFDTLVTFGDSYTDDGRLGYYINHNGKAPPAGVYHDVSNTTASGGLAWGQWAAQFAGVKNYLDYAVSGATCSNKIISREFSAINGPFPSVTDDEIPSYKQDIAFKALYPDRTASNTVYALWIGTNDLGFGGFLSDSQAPGTTITDYVKCVWAVFDSLYATGGRRFVLLNLAPLQLSPLYAVPEKGGTYDSQFWANKTLYNITEYSYKIMEYTTTVNTVFKYGVPFERASRWPEASFSVFDVHSLLTDIYNSPQKYLDAPYNATGYWHHCSSTGANCVDLSTLGPRSGFLWYDELHPSDKTDSIIAKNFLDVLAGNSTYGTHYGP